MKAKKTVSEAQRKAARTRFNEAVTKAKADEAKVLKRIAHEMGLEEGHLDNVKVWEAFDQELAPEELLPVPAAKRAALPSNEVLAVVHDALARRGFVHVVLIPGHRIEDESMEEWFTPGDLQKLGRLLLNAITAGDIEFAETVRAAIKGADKLFNRKFEKVLLPHAITAVSRWRHPWPRGGAARKRLEADLRRKFEDSQWKQISRALRIQGERGRPNK